MLDRLHAVDWKQAKSGLTLVFAAVIAMASIFALLIVRGEVVAADRARTQQTLIAQHKEAAAQHARTRVTIAAVCKRIHRLDLALQGLVAVSSSEKVLKQTAYYREHPQELQRAIDQAKRDQGVLQKADCSPNELGLPHQ